MGGYDEHADDDGTLKWQPNHYAHLFQTPVLAAASYYQIKCVINEPGADAYESN